VESQKIKHSTDSVLPIQFFKSHAVVSNTNQNTFTSSGTTGLTTSKHLVTDTSIYTESYPKGFLREHRRLCSFGFTTILPGKKDLLNLYGRRFCPIMTKAVLFAQS
jgi:hypothetical protein